METNTNMIWSRPLTLRYYRITTLLEVYFGTRKILWANAQIQISFRTTPGLFCASDRKKTIIWYRVIYETMGGAKIRDRSYGRFL